MSEKKFLDKGGISYLWRKIKDNFPDNTFLQALVQEIETELNKKVNSSDMVAITTQEMDNIFSRNN